MKKVIISCFIYIVSSALFAMQLPKFSELSHEELTAYWQSDYYEASLQRGKCGFKAKTQSFKNFNEWSKRWEVMCAGCGSNFFLEATACSVMHCDNCRPLGIDISTCAYCYRIHVSGKLCFAGITKDWHICPRDCAAPFHSDVEKNRMPMPLCACTHKSR